MGCYFLRFFQMVAALGSVLGGASAAWGACGTPGTPIPGGILLGDLSKITTHLLDSYFYVDVRETPSPTNVDSPTDGPLKDLAVMGLQYDLKVPGAKGRILKAWRLYSAIEESAGPTSAEAYFKLLSDGGKSLDTRSKLLVLSLLGSKLSDGYDKSLPGDVTSQDQIYVNARGSGKTGGVCRDIHGFLAEAGRRLGLPDCGLHNGIWQQTPGGDIGRHAIAHCRDPETREFYIINYASILNTHKTSLTEAIDISSRVLAPTNMTSTIESAPGKTHLYQPRVSRWVRDAIGGQAEISPEQSIFVVRVSNRETTVGANVFAAGTPRFGIKAWGLHSEVKGSDGKYKIDAFGISGKYEGRYKVESKLGPELGATVAWTTGAMSLTVPRVTLGEGNGEPWARTVLIASGSVKGTAKINSVTGRLEFKADALDIGVPGNPGEKNEESRVYNAGVAGVNWAPPGGALSVDASRTVNVAIGSIVDPKSKLITAYDKISVVIDTRGKSKQVYLVNKTDVYLFGGVENMDAIGIKNQLKAVISSEKLGEVYLVQESTGIVANPSKDPYYVHGPSVSLGVGYEKSFGSHVKTGVDLSYQYGRPFWLFEDAGKVTPDSGSADKPVAAGQLWTRLVW